MKRGFVTAYSIVAFVVLAVAVTWFCVSVFSEASKGAEEAERTFSWICRETAQNSYSLGFMTDAYVEKTTALCQGVNTLIAMTISSPTETFYAWPAASPALADAGDRSLEVQRTSLFSKVMDAGVDMGANTSPAIRITASLRTLSPSAIFSASRNSFILVFLVLLSSIIVLLVTPSQAEAIERGGKKKGAFGDFSKEVEAEKDHADFSKESAVQPAEWTADYAANPAAEEPYSNEEPYIEDEASKDGYGELDSGEQDWGTEQAEELEAEEPLEAAPYDEFEGEGEEEEGLAAAEGDADEYEEELPQQARYFSQVSGFVMETYLEEKLNEELIRAASSDCDVSILILRVFNMNRADESFFSIAKILVDIFTYRDLIFEFGEDAEVCIIPGATLDETMQIAEQLYGLVSGYLAELGLDNKVCIGISTRMTRALPASRMIREADTAARRAEAEVSPPIVAFRADPEKYREYMARNTSQS